MATSDATQRDRPASARRGRWEDDLDTGEPTLVARLVRLNLLTTAAHERIAAKAGVSYADYLILAVVRRSVDGRTTPSRICEVLRRASGGMTLALDRLEEAGLLTRTADTGDRRRVNVTLTEQGRTLAVEVNRELHRWERDLALSATDRDAMIRGIDALLEGWDE